MKTKVENRKFRMSFAELQYASSEKLAFMKRDVKKFEKYGISEIAIISFGAKLKELSNMPTDDDFLSELTSVTLTKEEVTENLRLQLRNIILRSILTFGMELTEKRKLNVPKLAQLVDYRLLLAAGTIVENALTYSDELEEVGLNLDFFEETGFQIKHLENLLEEKSRLIAMRDIATHNKLLRANELFTQLVALCKVGKNIWSSIDKDRYADYDLRSSVIKKPNTNSDIEPGNTITETKNSDKGVTTKPAA
ncbi:MAG TPA: hypothetical protein DCQ31_12785 [Bacteroidales bacterium]|nr:hypothetical protein [Bacteroidales bacterium]